MFFSLGFCPFHLKYILTHHLNQVLALSCILSISFGIYFVLGLYFFSFIWNVFLPLAVFCLFHLKCILAFGCFLSPSFEMHSRLWLFFALFIWNVFWPWAVFCIFHLKCILALGYGGGHPVVTSALISHISGSVPMLPCTPMAFSFCYFVFPCIPTTYANWHFCISLHSTGI